MRSPSRVHVAALVLLIPTWSGNGGGNNLRERVVKENSARRNRGRRAFCVKGSGWDPRFESSRRVPRPRPRAGCAGLRKLRSFPDEEMVNLLRTRRFGTRTAPNPSVDTLLHAFRRNAFIGTTRTRRTRILRCEPARPRRADPRGAGKRWWCCRNFLPGFRLAKLAAECFEGKRERRRLLLLKHGRSRSQGFAHEHSGPSTPSRTRVERFLDARLRGPSPQRRGRRRRCKARIARSVPSLPPARLSQLHPISRTPNILEHRATPELLGVDCRSRVRLSPNPLGPLTPDHVVRPTAQHLSIDHPFLDVSKRLRGQVAPPRSSPSAR